MWIVFLIGRSIGTDNVCRDRLEKTIILFTKVVSLFFLILIMFSQVKYRYSSLVKKVVFFKHTFLI